MRFMALPLCVEVVMSNFASDLLCLPNPPYLWQCVYKLVAGGVLLRLEVSSFVSTSHRRIQHPFCVSLQVSAVQIAMATLHHV